MGALLPGSRRSSRAGLICIVPAAVVAAGTVLLLLHGEAVSEFVRAVSPGCLFRRWFGVSCPGCGGTRAFCALAKGDFAGALRCNFWWLPTAVVLFSKSSSQAPCPTQKISLRRRKTSNYVWSSGMFARLSTGELR